jgi:hypothetical protein
MPENISLLGNILSRRIVAECIKMFFWSTLRDSSIRMSI